MKVLTAILNHNFNSEAIELKYRFGKITRVCLIDSGSILSSDQKPHFDVILGNVYYSGMLNAIVPFLKGENFDWVLIIASDVTIAHEHIFFERMDNLQSRIGVYAPSVPEYGSNHPQMRTIVNQGYKQVPFVDGFCFAMRPELFLRSMPIDLSVNPIGWGVDIYFAYVAHRMGYTCIVDHGNRVEHRVGPNKSSNPESYLRMARKQRSDWFRLIEMDGRNPGFKLFRRLMHVQFLKNTFGAKVVKRLASFK